MSLHSRPADPSAAPVSEAGRVLNPLQEKLRRDEVVVVVNPDHPSPSLTEFICGLGFDGVFIDCEHGMASMERVQEMCRAARAARACSIVRPESAMPWLITRYLDAGADGIMVPHVDTAEAARQVVSTVRYSRPRDHGSKIIIVMAESLTAIENLDAMLEVQGIDVFFIGPNDLSSSMGLPGQIHHQRVKTLVKSTIGRIRQAGKTAGTLVVRETAAEYVDAGCRYLYEHMNNLLVTGAKDFRQRLETAPG